MTTTSPSGLPMTSFFYLLTKSSAYAMKMIEISEAEINSEMCSVWRASYLRKIKGTPEGVQVYQMARDKIWERKLEEKCPKVSLTSK